MLSILKELTGSTVEVSLLNGKRIEGWLQVDDKERYYLKGWDGDNDTHDKYQIVYLNPEHITYIQTYWYLPKDSDDTTSS